MEQRIIDILQIVFENHSAEEQAEIIGELSRTLPTESSRIEWKIGAGYKEEDNEIGLSFSPIVSPAQAQENHSFAQIMAFYLSKSQELDRAEIYYRLLAFWQDAQAHTVRIFCIPSGFVGEKGVAHWRLGGLPTLQAEAEHKQYKQEERELIKKLAHATKEM
jgi:hypothetical protein